MNRLAAHTMHDPTAALAYALRDAGEPRAELYQDGTSGGLICVRVPLTDDTSEYATSYFIACEGRTPYSTDENPVYVWTGQLVLADGDVGDVTSDVIQRGGDGADYVAKHLVPVIRLQRELLAEAE